MTIVQFDSQKIEQLLNSATSERQRKMYQALLDKARSQERSSTTNKAPETTPSTEKTAQTLTKGKTETKTQTQKKTQTVKKNKKTTPQSATTEVSTSTKQSSKTVTESSSLPPKPETPDPATSAIDVAPQTEPKSQSQSKKSQSKKRKKQQTAAETPIFQAIGAVIATAYLKDDLFKVAINGCEYDLFYAQGFRRQTYSLLREELEKNGSSQMFLRLYPKVKFDYKTSQPRLSFSLVNFSRACEKINDYPQGFVLRGIWQYISHYESPVITIYRNHEQKGFFKKLSKSRQLSFAQPLHIPVVWDAPVEPFKFNPEAEKDSQMPRYFVEVRAIFKDGLYVVEEMMSEPTRKHPKFIKVSKKEQHKSVEKTAQKAELSATT